MPVLSRRDAVLGVAALAAAAPVRAGPDDAAPDIRLVELGDGIALHYVEAGKGAPVVFVHGSLSDGGYWSDQVGPFSGAHRVVAYSRRYNVPNDNPARPGYSAVVDAQDLARLIERLGLKRVDVVGHSYGALTALFLASLRPDLVNRIVLCEAPAVSLLGSLSGPEAAEGRAMFDDIQARMVAPMHAAFTRGDREAGVAVFIDYVFGDPRAWEKMPDAAKRETLRDAHEWDVMMTTGELFPVLDPDAVRRISAPALLLSGAKSYPFLRLIDAELTRLLPDARRIVFDRAGHQMWLQEPDACRRAVLEFLA
ncbi:MAG: alpha/beta hydrolase [Caulobacteraceae bacterium]|nr:alpha/beta hydrolase [Caulobacteraceae bacterium]